MEPASDFLFVGGGQNNLTAAAYLAAAGHGVTVLERHAYYGGGCVSREVTQPGFRHDLHATNIFMARANPLLARDELGLIARFGLRFSDTAEAVTHGTIFDDGSVLPLNTDMERSAAHIARFSERDAESYRAFMARADQYMSLLTLALFSPPVKGETFRSLLARSEEGRYLLGLMQSSSVDLITRHFTDERTRVHLLRLASEMMMRADSPGGGFGLMLMAGLYHRHHAGFVVGGSQGFSDALVRCIEHHGGKVVTDADVTRIDVARGRATAACTADGRRFPARLAVVAGLAPWDLSRFVAGTEAITEKVKPVPTSDYTCFLTHIALAEAPAPAVDPAFARMGFNVLAPRDFGAMVRMTQEAGQGRLTKDFTASYVCATHFDTSRAPAGQHTLYLYRPVPTVMAGQPIEAWDAIRDDYGADMIAQARRYIPNLTADAILGVAHESPCDIARSSPSYRNGDVAGLAMTPDQFLGGRPIPELANYKVPGLEGLYLCGPFMHPGGGANGGGRPVAMRIMMDMGMPLSPFHY